MLDLAFVRANFPLVEEKLRARGADTSALADFATLDAERRAAITEVETLKAQRNSISQEFGRRKRAGEDVHLLEMQTGTLKAQTEHLESVADSADARLR